MDTSDEYETTDVVICGCGPTGALLSAYLGRMGVSNIVLERESGITTDPRGIALDEDGIRLIQGIGIYEHVYREIGTCMLYRTELLSDGLERRVKCTLLTTSVSG
jgi:2-polyprenyl-6-methoxyphenol hydroxylase-like FAD-dependent oxidoreductase